MTQRPDRGDFDRRPPMPLTEYEQTVRRVNVGYELGLVLVESVLRARRRPDLHLLVVGAGGGAEIEAFLPSNPGWRLTGVDPSADMLAIARAKAERLGVAGPVELIRGTVNDLPADAAFDAATCLFVLHFLPRDAQLGLLRGIAAGRRGDAPLLLASGARLEPAPALRDDLVGMWQQYGERAAMPPERMARRSRASWPSRSRLRRSTCASCRPPGSPT